MIEFVEYPDSEPYRSLGGFVAAEWAPPEFILAGHTQHAIMQAMMDFQGRDWRRVKREVKKAIKRVKVRCG